MADDAENVRACTLELDGGEFLEGEAPPKSGGRSGSTAFFAPAANDFAFRCSKSRKWWIGRS